MSFVVFADGTSNLPGFLRKGIRMLPCEYTVDGVSTVYTGDLESFDVHGYYESLRNGLEVRTTLLNTHLFLTEFLPVLKEGLDVIYVAMSSGISGTFSAAVAAAQELMAEFKDRFIHIVDSMGCGLGTGMLAARAQRLSDADVDVRDAAKILDEEVPHTCQYFTVDDLNFLKRTGRVSGMTARIGTVLNIKPILYGDKEGHIVSCGIARGRRKAIDDLVKKYRDKHLDDQDMGVYISHGDCLEEAEQLAEKVKAVTPDVNLTICKHEPFSGSHVGPGMLSLFFRGRER
nr:DegV family protein [Lachnospiraceae bacterium]